MLVSHFVLNIRFGVFIFASLCPFFLSILCLFPLLRFAACFCFLSSSFFILSCPLWPDLGFFNFSFICLPRMRKLTFLLCFYQCVFTFSVLHMSVLTFLYYFAALSVFPLVLCHFFVVFIPFTSALPACFKHCLTLTALLPINACS